MEPQGTWFDYSNKNSTAEICGSDLPKLLNIQMNLELKRFSKYIDGTIIGTGEADFTKGNVEYEFTHFDRPFQLIDVPGIEGEESKYEQLLEQAVAKAHLIFYVNGTNKKPEVTTAKKIKRYLSRDAMVYAICNIRGKADSYEFEDDRIDLDATHKGTDKTKAQTTEVLENILGKELVLGAESVQGLLGFCSVAFTDNKVSTISRDRSYDLIKAQKSYYRNFGLKSEMKRFSKIENIENLIIKKLNNFKEDIVESNKKKILRLIDDNLQILNEHLEQHEEIIRDIKSEFDSCISAIEKKLQFFSSSIRNKRNQVMNSFFTNIEDLTCEIIRESFGNKDSIELKVNELIKAEKDSVRPRLNEIQQSEIKNLTEGIDSALKRLKEDINRVKFQHELKKLSISGISLTSALEAIGYNMKEIGGILLNIVSYTLTGVVLGGFGGPIGSIIGGGIGAIVGIFSSALNYYFGGKEKKIRKAQANARKSIEDVKKEFKATFDKETT